MSVSGGVVASSPTDFHYIFPEKDTPIYTVVFMGSIPPAQTAKYGHSTNGFVSFRTESIES